jgi:hypothetical protein
MILHDCFDRILIVRLRDRLDCISRYLRNCVSWESKCASPRSKSGMPPFPRTGVGCLRVESAAIF